MTTFKQWLVEGTTSDVQRLRDKLKRAEADLKDMSVTPYSQEAADAIDDAREDVKRLRAELAALTKKSKTEVQEAAGYTAASAYTQRANDVKQQLVRLEALVQSHLAVHQANPQSWLPVGDMAHLHEELDKIIEWMEGNET